MTDSKYDDNGLISNSNDDFDTALRQSEKIQFKPLQFNGISLDTGLTTDLDDDLFDDADDPDLNWQPDLVGIDDICSVPLATDATSQGSASYAADMNQGLNHPTGDQTSVNDYNASVPLAQATDLATSQNTQAATSTDNVQKIAASAADDAQVAASVQTTDPVENSTQTTKVDQEPKAETLANGTTVIWPGGSHIRMGKNAHPVLQNSQPVKSTAETIKEAKEAASYFNSSSSDDIMSDSNNESQMAISKSAHVQQKSENQAEWEPVEAPKQTTQVLSQTGTDSVANANSSVPDVNNRTVLPADQPIGESEAEQTINQPTQSSSAPNNQADNFSDKASNDKTTTNESGSIETNDDASAAAQLKPAEKAATTHVASLDEALKTPIDNIASQIKAQPEDQNSDDFYDGLDQVASDPDQYEHKDFVDMNPDTHEINITHTFKKRKA